MEHLILVSYNWKVRQNYAKRRKLFLVKAAEQMAVSQRTGLLPWMFFHGRTVLYNAGQATQYQSA